MFLCDRPVDNGGGYSHYIRREGFPNLSFHAYRCFRQRARPDSAAAAPERVPGLAVRLSGSDTMVDMDVEYDIDNRNNKTRIISVRFSRKQEIEIYESL